MFGNEHPIDHVLHAAIAAVPAARSRKPMAFASSPCAISALAMTWLRCGPGPDTR